MLLAEFRANFPFDSHLCSLADPLGAPLLSPVVNSQPSYTMVQASDDAVYQGFAEAKRDDFEANKEKETIASSGEHELDGIHDGLEFPTGMPIAHDPKHHH